MRPFIRLAIKFCRFHLLTPGGGLVALLLTSCSDSPGKTTKEPATQPRTVQAAAVELRPMERVVTVTGSLAAQEQATLSVKVPGRLRLIRVDLGSLVQSGEIIAEIEPLDYEIRLRQAAAAVAEARAALGLPLEGTNDVIEVEATSAVRGALAVLNEATRNRDRLRDLAKADLISPSQLDTVEAAHQVALNRHQTALQESSTRIATLALRRAELALAQKQLSDTVVRAPFDGAVQQRQASLGEYVAAGTPIITLVRTDPLRLRLEVPEREAAGVRFEQTVRLRTESHTNVWMGRISRLSPAINELNRMLVVEADIPNDGTLRPGLFVRAEIVVEENDEGLAIPPLAVITFAGLEKVILIQKEQALERTIATGRTGPGWVEVTRGLKAGDLVVLEPGSLRTGQSVIVGNVKVTTAPERYGESNGNSRSGP